MLAKYIILIKQNSAIACYLCGFVDFVECVYNPTETLQ